MSSLCVYHVSSPALPNKVLTHLEDIASTLAEHGVTFDRWQAETPLARDASHEEVISAYRTQIDKLMTEHGHGLMDVLSVKRDHPQKAELRAELLEEHHYDNDVVRFFAAGLGLFSLHIGDFVYAVQCERNDLISIPAGTRHWFDMGEHPHLVMIRLARDAQGRAPKFNSESIAGQFPRLDD
jgi:1,2-dihydroxy-3-keto-5-methylthiopentene dioxygenase